ncbi:hypothetical protein LUZ60_015531 [Juncus effusus]|nr:hypothetical protein LUZ60_015531 [Juncus effusus]
MEHEKEREAESSSHALSTEEQDKKTGEEAVSHNIDDQEKVAEQQAANPAQCMCPEGVCICNYLPSLPFATQTTVLLLHHPDETKHSVNHLATLSFLCNGLSSLQLISGRRFYPGQIPLLDSLQECLSSSSPVLFLFPTPDAVDLSEWVRLTPSENRIQPILVVVDGTWNQAWEMANNSFPFLSQFSTCVSLGPEDRMDAGKSSEMTTIVAVARALRILEPQGASTDALVDALMRVRGATLGRGPMAGSSIMKSRCKTKKNTGNK